MTEHQLWPVPTPATLTAYPVEGGGPAIVVLPGGGYARQAGHEGEPVARWLNTLGIAAFVLRYRVAPHRHPLPLLDAARAMRFVRHHASEWGVDPLRVGVLGFSAGGHLAGLLATETAAMLPEGPHDEIDRKDARPGVAVLCYPVVTLSGAPAHQGSVTNLLGPEPAGAQLAGLSLQHRAGPATPPVFLWHTTEDDVVPVDNSLLLASALAAHQVPVELHVYPNGKHGLGLAEAEPGAGEWTTACARFLRTQGW
ncbi:alpha/beta hydrolase [Nonomuraea sp. NPDC000554]|uniref:alpha/beta hydrolase n=1 Tax=Nonomuraea sp. NPDC000554 TaxID=3154259 RepID=UPI0033272023